MLVHENFDGKYECATEECYCRMLKKAVSAAAASEEARRYMPSFA
jgi:hypothetical protein